MSRADRFRPIVRAARAIFLWAGLLRSLPAWWSSRLPAGEIRLSAMTGFNSGGDRGAGQVRRRSCARQSGSAPRAYARPANFPSPVVGNENARSVPALILRQFLGKNKSVRPGVVGRGKDRPRFVRITVAVVNVEIEPASFGQDPGLGFVKFIKPRREALNMTPGCVL